eukprot:UN16895
MCHETMAIMVFVALPVLWCSDSHNLLHSGPLSSNSLFHTRWCKELHPVHEATVFHTCGATGHSQTRCRDVSGLSRHRSRSSHSAILSSEDGRCTRVGLGAVAKEHFHFPWGPDLPNDAFEAAWLIAVELCEIRRPCR